MGDPIALAGVRSGSLLGYLKALGLLTIVARQADADAKIAWVGGELRLHCAFELEELERFLLDAWVPAPIVSPWNGGSGFYRGRDAAINRIAASADPRLAPLATSIRAVRAFLSKRVITEKPATDAEKHAMVRQLRTLLPDEAVEWLDAAVVIQPRKLDFPPALGSGGNDGNWDFSDNYLHAVVTVLFGDPSDEALAASLLGQRVPLTRKLSLAHLSRDASPVNSPSGEADALGNPWDLVLALHGTLLWSAGATRRLGAVQAGHAAPFTLRPSGAGYGSAVPGEAGRHELWMPTWERPAHYNEIVALFREGRAQVGRRQASTGLDAARAAGELGVARGITGFERIVVLERAGLSNLALHAGRIEVRANPAADALATLDAWLARVLRHGTGDIPQSQRHAIRALERRAFALAERNSPTRAADLLAAAGEVEVVLGRAADTERPMGLRPLRAPADPWVKLLDPDCAEHRLAVAVASLRDDERQADGVPLRESLTGFGNRYADRARWIAPGSAPLHERLAAVAERRWLTMEAHDPRFRYGAEVAVADLERFAAGHADAGLGALICGLVRLTWRADTPRLHPSIAPVWPPDPLLRHLILAIHLDDGAQDARAPERDMASQIRAGGAHVLRARDSALRHLLLSGRRPIASAGDLRPARASSGAWLLAALLAKPSRQELAVIRDQLTTATESAETTPPVESPA